MAKKKKEGIFKKITRRLKRNKVVEPKVSGNTTRIIMQAKKDAIYGPEEEELPPLEVTLPDTETLKITKYQAYGKDFWHAAYLDNIKKTSRFRKEIIRKDPITRKFTRVERGPRISGFYHEDRLY